MVSGADFSNAAAVCNPNTARITIIHREVYLVAFLKFWHSAENFDLKTKPENN